MSNQTTNSALSRVTTTIVDGRPSGSMSIESANVYGLESSVFVGGVTRDDIEAIRRRQVDTELISFLPDPSQISDTAKIELVEEVGRLLSNYNRAPDLAKVLIQFGIDAFDCGRDHGRYQREEEERTWIEFENVFQNLVALLRGIG